MRQKPLNIRTTVALRLAHADADTVHPLTTSEGDLRCYSTHRHGTLVSLCLFGYVMEHDFPVPPLLTLVRMNTRTIVVRVPGLVSIFGCSFFSPLLLVFLRCNECNLLQIIRVPSLSRPGRQALSLSLSLSALPLASNCLTAGGHLVNFGLLRNPGSETDRERERERGQRGQPKAEPLARIFISPAYKSAHLTPMLRRQDGNYCLLAI